MIIVMKPGASEEVIKEVTRTMEGMGMQVAPCIGVEYAVLGIIGNTHNLDKASISLLNGVSKVMSVQEPYKKANKKFRPNKSIINVGDAKFGSEDIVMIAGPCSVESEEQIVSIAKSVKKSGAKLLRGGAFKPRSSPYSFQGLEAQGLELLRVARKEVGIPIVTEIMSLRHLDLFSDVDMIQIGARNMQNFDLLKELGKTDKPILLKRGFAATIEEWLMSAEYIMSGGNDNVVLCERGIRTFETYTRNTLDISSVPAVNRLSHLPVIVDPSHATGMNWMVESMSLASIAAGADGLIIEVHNNPCKALCDGQQSLEPVEFDELTKKINAIAKVIGKKVEA